VSGPPLDARVADLAAEPGRTWGVRDAALGVVAVPLSLLAALLLLAALPDVSTAVSAAVASALLGAATVLVARRPAHQSGGIERALGFDLPEWSDSGRVVGWSLLLTLAQGVALVLLAAAVPALRGVPADNASFLRDQPPLSLVVLVVAAVLVAPVLEELLFRGVVLRGLMLRLGFWPAALVSSACFGAFHATGAGVEAVPVVVATAVFGLGLCVLTRRTGRLGPGIGVTRCATRSRWEQWCSAPDGPVPSGRPRLAGTSFLEAPA
jgi:membrane protease YdiL (CAAX protease family)